MITNVLSLLLKHKLCFFGTESYTWVSNRWSFVTH